MVETERSFWESELYDRRFDLIVVGAGLTGQSAAYFFKKNYPDKKVMVIDRGFYPIGASTRNAGFACFGSPTEHMDDLKIEDENKIIERIGRRLRGLKLLRKTLGDSAIGYREDPAYEIFTDDKIFEEAVSCLDRFNSWVDEVSGQKETYTVDEFQGYPAVRIKGEGSIHTGKMNRELYSKNVDLGVEFRWNTLVSGVDTVHASVTTKEGYKITGDRLMIATNAFSSKLIKDIDIKPGRGFVFVTKEMSDLKWKGNFHYDKGYYYFRNVGDRLLMGGARNMDTAGEETFEFGFNETIRDELISFTNDVVQLPKGWEIEYEWSGIMGFTSTKSPILQMKGDRTVIAAGLSGMGVALGMELGKEAISMIG